jgi:ATP/maltotriose-dependent transcriptional regulator MalT
MPKKVLQGLVELSARQVQVLEKVCQALPDKAIGKELGISARTVHHHLEAIYQQLQISQDRQNARVAAVLAVRSGRVKGLVLSVLMLALLSNQSSALVRGRVRIREFSALVGAAFVA